MHPYMLHAYAKARSAELEQQARPAHAPTAPAGRTPRQAARRRRRIALGLALGRRLQPSRQADAP
jgi:hypothetical protein